MRKKITFLMALACMGALSVSGATPQKKVAEITSEKRIVADGGNQLYWEDSYCEVFFYDKNGNETSWTRYKNSKKEGSYGTIAREYDDQNRLVKETEGTNVTTYTYNANGLLEGKVKANRWTTERTSYKYDANGNLLSEETTKDGSQYDKESSVIYTYDSAGNLTVMTSYGNHMEYDDRTGKSVKQYVKMRAVKYFYENDQVATDTTITYGYRIDDSGTGLAETGTSVKGYSHFIYNTDETLQKDTIWWYDDYTGAILPKAHEYTYENGLLVEKKEKDTWIPPTGSEREFLDTYVYTYHYAPVGPDYVPTITGITAGEEFASIVITITPPAVTEGLQGYKLMVDGIVKDDMLTATDNKIKVGKQKRGECAYSLLPIYEGMTAACASESFTYKLEVNLNKARNLRLASCERSVLGWNIKVRWDAPEEGNGTLIGYRMTSTSETVPDVEENQGKNITKLYNEMRQQPNNIYTYYLYAVYEEGESDPITITEDFKTDLKRVVVDYTCDNIAELKKAYDGAKEDGKTKEFTLNSLATVNGVVRDADSKVYGIYISDNSGAIKLTGSVNAIAKHNIKNVKGTMSKTEQGQYVFNCTSLEDDGYANPAPTPALTDFVPFYEISAYSLGTKQSKFYTFKNVTVEVKTDANGVKYAEVTQKNAEVDYEYDTDPDIPTPVYKDITMKLIDPSNKVFTAEKVYTPANITGAFLEIDAEGKPCWVLKDKESFEAVVPAPTGLELVAYECKVQYGSHKWGGKAVWNAPEGAENFTLKNYKLTITPVEGKGYASPNTVNTPYSYSWVYTAQKEAGEEDLVKIAVVAIYEEGTSEPCEIEFDFTDRTKVLRNYDKNDLYEMISGGVDPDNHEYNFVGEATIAGIVPNYAAYLADDKGVMKVNFPAEKLTDLAMGSVITNMKGVLKKTSLGQWYFDATEVEKTDKTATVDPKEVNVDVSTGNQNKLVVMKNVKMTVEMDPLKRAVVGTLTQVLYPGEEWEETVTGKLYDPSGTILTKYVGKGELDVKSVVAFVDIDQNEESKKVSKLILRGAPDDLLVEGVEEYATLQSVKEASFDEDVTYTGKALVTGKVPNAMSFIYFIQDETGAMNGMMKFGMENLPAMGDTITNVVFMSYSQAEGFMCKAFEVVSSGATVTPENRTLAEIKTNGDADNAKFVKISDAVIECELDDEKSFIKVFNLIQGTDTTAVDYKGDAVAEAAAMNGATVEMKCYVFGTSLRLGDVSDIKVTKEPVPVRANLKEVKEGDSKNCVVSGKVLVIGKVVNFASYIYFLQDETANIVMMGNKADKVINKGDSIVNLQGYYAQGMFYYAGAEIVSNNNEVKAEEKTLAEFDPEADDAHYLFIRNAVLNFTMNEAGDAFKVKPTLTQDGKSVNIDYYGEDYATMKDLNGKPVDVNCYVFEGKLRLSDPVSTEMKVNPEAISTIGADRLYVADGNVIAEGAVGITVYDMTGRVLAASETNQVSVAGLSGTLVVKVSYANGDVKVSKLMVR